MRVIHVLILVVSVITLTACGSSANSAKEKLLYAKIEREKSQLKTKETELMLMQSDLEAKKVDLASERLELQMMRAELEREEFLTLSDEKLTDILSTCTAAVFEEARERNRGPYSLALVEEYSANSYIYAAGDRATKNSEYRVKSFRNTGVINGEYAIISASDTFSGPIKSVTNYSCEFGSNLKIGKVRKVHEAYM